MAARELESDNEISEEEQEQELLDIHEEELEAVRLTFSQKIIVGLSVFLSFLFFSLIFLPYEQIVRRALQSYSRMVRVDFSRLDLNLFDTDRVSDLRITLPDGTSLHATTLVSSLGYRELISAHPHGKVIVENLDVSLTNFALLIRSLESDVNLMDVTEGMDRWKGDLFVKTGAIEIQKIPESIPIPVTASDVKIHSVKLQLKFADGRVNMNGSSIKSNVFDIELSGSGRLGGGSITLDTTVCLTPKPDLEQTNNILFGLYLAQGGSAGGRLCLNVTGPPSSPSFKKKDE